MCLNETYSKVRIGKRLSDSFPTKNDLKQAEALSPLLYDFVLQYAIRKFQQNLVGRKLNGTQQLLAYADDVKLLGNNIVNINQKTETLTGAIKAIVRLEELGQLKNPVNSWQLNPQICGLCHSTSTKYVTAAPLRSRKFMFPFIQMPYFC
jgi:hypothetical protein